MNGPRIGRTIADSTPHWPAPASPPRGAPNILVVVLDGDGIGRAEMARQ